MSPKTFVTFTFSPSIGIGRSSRAGQDGTEKDEMYSAPANVMANSSRE